MIHGHYEGSLFLPAIDVIQIGIDYDMRSGWAARVAHRHSGQVWGRCEPEYYEALASEELPGLLDAVVTALLAL